MATEKNRRPISWGTTSAHRISPTRVFHPNEDCIIALTTFELYAQCLGIGTLWDGFAYEAINDLLPEIKQTLRIPDNHIIGYMMAFGYPAVRHQRTVQHGGEYGACGLVE